MAQWKDGVKVENATPRGTLMSILRPIVIRSQKFLLHTIALARSRERIKSEFILSVGYGFTVTVTFGFLIRRKVYFA